jgi:hypothetical protein
LTFCLVPFAFGLWPFAFFIEHRKIMKRIAHKSTSFKEAAAYDIEQQISLTAVRRLAAARRLKKRIFSGKHPDIREWQRKK